MADAAIRRRAAIRSLSRFRIGRSRSPGRR
jgi:hypothetical protein